MNRTSRPYARRIPTAAAALLLAALLLFCATPGTAPAAPLPDNDLAPAIADASLFEQPLARIPAFQGAGYTWVETGTILRFPDLDATFAAQPVGEVLARIAPNTSPPHASALKISLYNRGDDGPISATAFGSKLTNTLIAISHAFLVRPAKADRRIHPTDARLVIGGFRWALPRTEVLLEYSTEPYANTFRPVPEYIRLSVRPTVAVGPAATHPTAPGAPAFPRRSAFVPRPNAATNVTHPTPTSLVITNIPMVDQGEKGYCAPATVARVLAYYGHSHIDQHQVASWAGTTADGGTSLKNMIPALRRRLPQECALNVQLAYELDTKEFQDILRRYNQVARRNNLLPAQAILIGPNTIGMNNTLQALDTDTLREVRCRNAGAAIAWLGNLRRHLDKGQPVIWCIDSSRLPPPDPLSPDARFPRGSHECLIIGYDANPSDPRLFFSDSWGAVSSLRTLSVPDAMLITTALVTITPR